jgi:TolA-binding protein
MRNGPFLIFCLALFSMFACGHLWFRARMASDDRVWTLRVAKLERDVGQFRLAAELARYELMDWRQHVATLIPSALEGARDDGTAFPLRTMASIAAGDVESRLEIEPATSQFERAKSAFRENRFEVASEGFKALLETFPSTRYGVEARFLLSEAQFQKKDYDGAVDTIEGLVAHFPESEMTGFALLRLGQIFEIQDRREDAAEVYRAVLKTYTNADLIAQSGRLLRAAE